MSSASRVLEVGCGTGAVLGEPPLNDDLHAHGLHGLDHDLHALQQCHLHAPAACLTCGEALALPYVSRLFDITYCHFLLLWIPDVLRVLQEMRRVTAPSGYILALAEPDYGARVDKPAELAELGKLQNAALNGQGAALRRGAELGELFFQAGIRIVETGIIQSPEDFAFSEEGWQSEWEVLQNDLAGTISSLEMKRYMDLDRAARLRRERAINVPTYFACGQV